MSLLYFLQFCAATLLYLCRYSVLFASASYLCPWCIFLCLWCSILSHMFCLQYRKYLRHNHICISHFNMLTKGRNVWSELFQTDSDKFLTFISNIIVRVKYIQLFIKIKLKWRWQKRCKWAANDYNVMPLDRNNQSSFSVHRYSFNTLDTLTHSILVLVINVLKPEPLNRIMNIRVSHSCVEVGWCFFSPNPNMH